MIEFKGLTKVYSSREGPAIQDINLTVQKGEILGLVGLNGAGKTTMIRIAAGLALPTAGSVAIDGHDIVSDKMRASAPLGIVTEFPNFEPSAKAIDLLEYLGGYNGLGGEDFRRRALQLLGEVGLEGSEFRKIGTFSQGMKKRFALASALLAFPQNLLLDEILNGLDPEGIRFIRALLLKLKASGITILLSSHILSEVEHVADRVAVIHKGRLIKLIPMGEISSSRNRRLRLVVRNPSAKVMEYLGTVGVVEADHPALTITEPSEEPWKINTELVRLGAEVAEMRMEKEDLETYFFRTIGGPR